MLDNKDSKVLIILKENSKLNLSQVAKKSALPITTVHNRIKKLEKEGVIKKYSIILDNKKIGNMISAFILVNIDYQEIKKEELSQIDIMKKIETNSSVEEAAMVTGRTDLIIKVNLKNMDELRKFISEFLQKIPGIKQTETLVVMN